MVIRDLLRVNANVLAFSKWNRNPSTFQQATLNAAWNLLDCLFTFWANSEWFCERHTGLFAIRCVYSSAFYSLMWMHLKDSARISIYNFFFLIETTPKSSYLWMLTSQSLPRILFLIILSSYLLGKDSCRPLSFGSM